MLSLAYAHASDTWHSEAVEVSNHALEIFKELSDKFSQARAWQCIAKSKSSMSQLESALGAAEIAVKLLKEASIEGDALSEALDVVAKIRDCIEKNPGLQAELEAKRKVQRDLDLQTLNEVVEALQMRKADGFKEKYDRMNECASLTEDDVTSALEPIMQVDYDAAQEWISSALGTSTCTHQFLYREYGYYINRTGGMHYGPAFRLITMFGSSTPLDDPFIATYGVLQLQTEVRESEWELQSLYHPPMYDCGLQVQIGGFKQPELFFHLHQGSQ